MRSLDSVAALSMYRPAEQTSLTGAHALPWVVSENDVPTTHSAHVRSAYAVPSCNRPSPTVHVRHAVQTSLPASPLKWPAAQLAHERSLERVAATSMYFPAVHGAPTVMHTLPSSLLENSVTPLHAVHVRSAISVPADAWPSPTGQVRHAAHASLPAMALKVPAAHVAHSRLDEAPGAAVSYSPAWHTAIAWHVRSEVSVGAANVKWPVGHDALCVLQPRSLMPVGAAYSYSVAEHVVTGVHAPPPFAAE